MTHNIDYSTQLKTILVKLVKNIFERACKNTKDVIGIRQWHKTVEAIKMFTNIKRKKDCTFIQFDICNF